MEGLNVNEVGDWLIEEGFSLEVVDAFSGTIVTGFFSYLCTFLFYNYRTGNGRHCNFSSIRYMPWARLPERGHL